MKLEIARFEVVPEPATMPVLAVIRMSLVAYTGLALIELAAAAVKKPSSYGYGLINYRRDSEATH